MKKMATRSVLWGCLVIFAACLMGLTPMALAGSISGQVTGGGAPVPYACLHAVDNRCQGNWYWAQADANGNYTIPGLPAGTYYVKTEASCAGPKFFVNEWWDGADGTRDCNQAGPVAVTAEGNTPGINFALAPGGIIRGSVLGPVGPIGNVSIDLNGEPCGGYPPGGSLTDSAGNYSMTVPAGTYFVRANPSPSGLNYLIQYWTGAAGSINCWDAAPVVVANGVLTDGINFSLEPGGSVSGHVSDASGNPIPNLHVDVEGQACGGEWLAGTFTDANGNYTVFGLPGGDAYVRTCAGCSATPLPYVDKWYNNVTDCHQATPVPVVVGQNTPGIDFSLEAGGFIYGQVVDPWGNPVPFVSVSAFSGLCWANWAGGTQTDQNGNYIISGLPFGDYYVVVQARCQTPHHLLDSWWTGYWGGTPDCSRAQPLNVSGPTWVDFGLVQGTPYPGPAFDRADMFSLRDAEGRMSTVFFAFVSGPSPEDVCSFTVSGPAGTFDMQPNLSFRQLGLLYQTRLDFVAPDGMYTFWLTDTMGRSVSVNRNFRFMHGVPQIDPATMFPPHMSYVGTTPLLRADPPITTQDSDVPGAFQYQVMVMDYHRKAVWYASDYQDQATFQVPEGLLQPNTPYLWFIRVIDRSTEGRNRTESPRFSFFTGAAGAPLLENPAVLSMTIPPYGPDKAYWLGVMSRNTAPWDVEYLKVMDGLGGVYNWYGQIDYWFTHPCYYSLLFWSTTSIPDRTYTFEMRDWNTNMGTVTRPYAYHPVDPVPEDTMYPEPNAYLDTNTPTFSWAALGNPDYRYRLRIRDANQKIIWYDSAFSSETSVTLPEWLNLPRGTSYMWQVMTMDSAGNNIAQTRPRLFTLNPFRFPKPDIQVNGQDGPVFVPPSVASNVEISLDPGDLPGEICDWWIGVLTPFGSYWFTYPSLSWVPSGAPVSVGKFGLMNLSPFQVLSYNLPTGIYTFFFILDNNPNGMLDDLTWYDYVNVFSSPERIQVDTASDPDEVFLEKIKAFMN